MPSHAKGRSAGEHIKTVLSPDLEALGESLSIEELSLRILEGPQRGLRLPLDREYLRIGRSELCNLVLSDPQISGEHCELQLDARGVKITDLDSSNGIFLGDCRILSAYLPPATRFRMGETVLELCVEHQEPKKIRIHHQDASGLLLGKSEAMRKLFSMLERYAAHDIPLLLTGETGTGKSSVAEAIHRQSPRAKGPFVYVDCGALPDNLISSELFGYEKGAFTGAIKQHQGYFEQAHGGTLFLDEIGELPLELQSKLLSAIQRRKIKRLGGRQEISIDLRLITATNRELDDDVLQGRFRQDLFYRIAVAEEEIPPLRERKEDIPLLAELFLRKFDPHRSLTLSSAAVARLQRYLWPGNVRELENAMQRVLLYLDGTQIEPEHIKLKPLGDGWDSEDAGATPSAAPMTLPDLSSLQGESLSLKQVVADTEKRILVQALQANDGSVSKASKQVGVSQGWMYELMKKHKIDKQSL